MKENLKKKINASRIQKSLINQLDINFEVFMVSRNANGINKTINWSLVSHLRLSSPVSISFAFFIDFGILMVGLIWWELTVTEELYCRKRDGVIVGRTRQCWSHHNPQCLNVIVLINEAEFHDNSSLYNISRLKGLHVVLDLSFDHRIKFEVNVACFILYKLYRELQVRISSRVICRQLGSALNCKIFKFGWSKMPIVMKGSGKFSPRE